uniref:sulfatase n=1 Tax=uncultured Draconibacterium sp. TaxID=1573823 RepID=UPI003217F3D3
MKKIAYCFCFIISAFLVHAQEDVRPNILFIAVDDLRPELGCYGAKQIKSPNIDKLAEGGFVFNRSYCNIPVCGASRASLLSGIRPDRQRFLNFSCWQDKDVPGVVSLPMFFKNNGYHTLSLGKIYHHIEDGKGSWSETPWYPKGDWEGWQAYITEEAQAQIEPRKSGVGINGVSFESPEGPDHIYPDGMIAQQTINKLNELKAGNQPFFLAVGFLKPHLPFSAPKKYWDMYDYKNIQLPDNMHKPKDAPDECMHPFGELRNYTDVPDKGPMEKEFMRKLIHGYYACVSYTDAQIGKVLDELERLDLAENTIVILWGDHGWHLGEHNLWCKHCNFEKVLHTPLILRAPGKGVAKQTDALVEYVDIYPTLCELSGLEKPFHLQGQSMVPLLSNPELPWKEEVYCRWIKGETVVTKTHAYTEWFRDGEEKGYTWMLYNHETDPEENINIAERKENRNLVKKLQEKLYLHMKERNNLKIPE